MWELSLMHFISRKLDPFLLMFALLDVLCSVDLHLSYLEERQWNTLHHYDRTIHSLWIRAVTFSKSQVRIIFRTCSLVADSLTEIANEEASGSTSLAAQTVDSDPAFDRKGRRIRK